MELKCKSQNWWIKSSRELPTHTWIHRRDKENNEYGRECREALVKRRLPRIQFPAIRARAVLLQCKCGKYCKSLSPVPCWTISARQCKMLCIWLCDHTRLPRDPLPNKKKTDSSIFSLHALLGRNLFCHRYTSSYKQAPHHIPVPCS